MKKVTIVASTNIEPLIVQRIGEMGKAEFHPVPSTAIEGYEGLFKHSYDSDEPKSRLEESIMIVKRKLPEEYEPSSIVDDKTLQSFAYNSKRTMEELIESLNELSKQLDTVRAQYDKVRHMSANELSSQKAEFESKKQELAQQTLITLAKAKSLQALNPDELKKCITAGVVSQKNLGDLEEHLKSSEITYKSEALSDTEVLVFIFGSEDILKRVANLFIVFDVNEIYEVFESGELLLVLSEDMLSKTLKLYSEKTEELDKLTKELGEKKRAAIEAINKKYGSDLNKLKSEYFEQATSLLEKKYTIVKTADYLVNYLNKYSNLPILRNPVLSVIQVWFDEEDRSAVESILEGLKGKDTNLLYTIEDISPKELKEYKNKTKTSS